MFYLMMHSTVIWRWTYGKGLNRFSREKTHWRLMGCSFRIVARVLLYAPSHIQDTIYSHTYIYIYICKHT